MHLVRLYVRTYHVESSTTMLPSALETLSFRSLVVFAESNSVAKNRPHDDRSIGTLTLEMIAPLYTKQVAWGDTIISNVTVVRD